MEIPADLELQPVQRRRAHEEVVHQIRREIVNGRLKVGDRLPGERQLSETLGVSRASVREAMRVLESLSIVRSQTGTGPNSGSIVISEIGDAFANALVMNTALDKVSLDEVIEVRGMLERYASRLAAQVAEPAQIEQLRVAVEEMERPDVEVQPFLDLDTNFHLIIAESCGNRLVANLMGSMREAILQTLGRIFSDIPDWADVRTTVAHEHREIFEAIRQGQGDQAADLVHAHIMLSYKRLQHAAETAAAVSSH